METVTNVAPNSREPGFVAWFFLQCGGQRTSVFNRAQAGRRSMRPPMVAASSRPAAVPDSSLGCGWAFNRALGLVPAILCLLANTGVGNSDPGSAGLGPKGDLRPTTGIRHSRSRSPTRALAVPLVLGPDSKIFLECAAYCGARSHHKV